MGLAQEEGIVLKSPPDTKIEVQKIEEQKKEFVCHYTKMAVLEKIFLPKFKS